MRFTRTLGSIIDRNTPPRETVWWEAKVRLDDGEEVHFSDLKITTIPIPNPTPEQLDRANRRTFKSYTIAEAAANPGYPDPPTVTDILQLMYARKDVGVKLADIGTDLPPLGHRSQGDVTYLKDTQLSATYNMYQNLTIGKQGTPAVPTAVPPIEAVPAIAPTISTQPGGAIIVVQDTLTINAGHLSADNSGAGVAAHGGWVGQPEEDHVSHGKVQEMLELLRRTDFRFHGNGWNASPVGGGGGGLPGGSPPGRGFTYCGQGGEGGPSGVFNVETHPGHGGGVLVIVTRNLVNHGVITARGGSVTDSQDNSGGGGGGFVAILYETAERVGNASARGGSAAGTGQPGKDGEVYASPLPASVMVMV